MDAPQQALVQNLHFLTLEFQHQMNRLTSIIFAAVMASGCAAAASIDDVLRSIEANNRELQAAASEGAAAVYERKSENTLSGLSVEYSPFWRGGVPGTSSSELVVAQEFDFPTLYAGRAKSAKLLQREVDSKLEATRREVLLAAKLKCIEIVALQRRHDLLEMRRKAAEELVGLYTKRYDNGNATILDLNRAKLDNMSTAAAAADNRAAITRARLELQAMNGGVALDLDGIDYPADAVPGASAIEAAVERDASLTAIEAGVNAARHDVGLSRQGWLPRLSAGYRRNTDGREASNGFLVGIAIPVWSTSAKVKAASSRLEAARLSLDDTREAVRTEAEASLAEINRLREVLAVYDAPLMHEQLTLMKRAVELGQMTLTDYYTEADRIYQELDERVTLESRCQSLTAQLLKYEL